MIDFNNRTYKNSLKILNSYDNMTMAESTDVQSKEAAPLLRQPLSAINHAGYYRQR